MHHMFIISGGTDGEFKTHSITFFAGQNISILNIPLPDNEMLKTFIVTINSSSLPKGVKTDLDQVIVKILQDGENLKVYANRLLFLMEA